MLISHDGKHKQILEHKEWKSLTTDHVILVPGPDEEVACVNEIYKMLIVDGLSVYAIANELNRRGIPYLAESKWSNQSVRRVLSHPKYIGFNVFAHTTQRLKTRVTSKPRSWWIMAPNACQPIVDRRTFLQAQQILANRCLNKPDNVLLDPLRSLLASHRKLTVSLIKMSDGMPSPNTYKRRFGSLTKAYALVGYENAKSRQIIAGRSRFQALRRALLSRLSVMFPERLSTVKPRGNWRTRVVVDDLCQVSVMIVRATRVERPTKIRWRVLLVPRETACVTLLARLDADNRYFMVFICSRV
jgi:hypothetical protein